MRLTASDTASLARAVGLGVLLDRADHLGDRADARRDEAAGLALLLGRAVHLAAELEGAPRRSSASRRWRATAPPSRVEICCTIDEVFCAASATCFELRACSPAARAISATRALASREELRMRVELLARLARALRRRDSTASMPAPIARTALLDSSCTARISALDLLGAAGGALRQRLHVVRDHRERLALLAGLRGDDRGVQREQVGLVVDRADHVHDLADLADALRQPLEHGLARGSSGSGSPRCRRSSRSPPAGPPRRPALTCSVSPEASRTCSPTSWIARSICDHRGRRLLGHALHGVGALGDLADAGADLVDRGRAGVDRLVAASRRCAPPRRSSSASRGSRRRPPRSSARGSRPRR